METETIQTIALVLGTGWASGLNLYAAMLVLGWMGISGQADLPPSLDILSNPLVMGAAGIMFVIEFFADKIPGFDSIWDSLHTFIRIPAGALIAAGAAQGLDLGAAGQFAGLILGGGLATTTHVSKASTRALINTSPEPVTNWTASITEDVAVVGGLWTALNYPWLFVVLLIAFILLTIWLLPKIWQLLRSAGKTLSRWFRRGPADDKG